MDQLGELRLSGPGGSGDQHGHGSGRAHRDPLQDPVHLRAVPRELVRSEPGPECFGPIGDLDGVVPDEHAFALARACVGEHEVTILPGGAHLSLRSHPREWMAWLQAFLARTPAQ